MGPLAWILLALLSPQQKREPVPDGVAQKAAEKLIREIYKDDYAKKRPGDRADLFRKLLDQSSQSSNDAPTRYVLLKEAQELAVQAGDAALALKAISEWGRRFEVDAVALKFAALQTLARGVKTPDEVRPISILFLELAGEALVADGVDGADRAADAALPLAKKAKDLALISRCDAKKKEIAGRRAAMEKVQKAREALAKDAADPQANRTLGLHLGAMRGEWDAGLPLLTRGDDAELKALAERDLSKPAKPEDQVAVADGWWDRAEKSGEPERRNYRLRAAFWYGRVLEGAAGLLHSKALLRLTEIRRENPAAPRVWVALEDPRYFGAQGPPGLPIEIIPGRRPPPVPFRDLPPGEYDGISFKVEIKPTSQALAAVTFESNQRSVLFNGAGRTLALNHMEAGNWVDDLKKQVGAQEVLSVVLVLEDGQYVLSVDGVEVGRCPTPFTRISDLALQVSSGPAAFAQVRLRRKD